MATDWRRLAVAPDIEVDADELVVSLAPNRRHRVRVFDEGDHLRLRGIVATPRRINDLDERTRTLWEYNRQTSLVGFRFDHRDRIVGECLLPIAGLTPDEFTFCARVVAADCDRYEYLLSGKDIF